MWEEKNGTLHRKFEFKDFDDAFAFMEVVAEVARQQDHHPRWQNNWNKVEFWLSTHDAGSLPAGRQGKITRKDKKLARAIDAAYKNRSLKTAKKSVFEALKLYSDGGSRGNPGKSAGAYVICKMDGAVVKKSGFYLGIATNNQAEYRALIKGLEQVKNLDAKKINVYLDSELVVKQLNGQYKIKHPDLLPLNAKVNKLGGQFDEISFSFVPRVMNKIADSEVNRILDKK